MQILWVEVKVSKAFETYSPPLLLIIVLILILVWFSTEFLDFFHEWWQRFAFEMKNKTNFYEEREFMILKKYPPTSNENGLIMWLKSLCIFSSFSDATSEWPRWGSQRCLGIMHGSQWSGRFAWGNTLLNGCWPTCPRWLWWSTPLVTEDKATGAYLGNSRKTRSNSMTPFPRFPGRIASMSCITSKKDDPLG